MLSARLNRCHSRLRRPPACTALREVIGHRTPRSGSNNRGLPGLGGTFPVPAATLDTFRAPYAGEFLTAAIQALHHLHGLHPDFVGLNTPCPSPEDRTSSAAAEGVASYYAPHRRCPSQGFRRCAPTGRFQAEPPACYWASRRLPRPDSRRLATTSSRTRRSTMALVAMSPPVLLGARNVEASQ
jgi:hypothetical protein